MNSDPRPSMGSRPTEADIRVYNAWAHRNGEPFWGAPPTAPAAPKAAAHAISNDVALAVQQGARARLNPSRLRWELSVRGGRRYTLTNEDGSHTRFGAQCSSVARRMGLDNYELNLWQEGLHMLDGSTADYAYDVNGQRRFVRRYNAATGQHELVGFGQSYFRNHRSRFTISLPIRRLIRKLRNGRYIFIETNNGEMWKYLTDDQIEEFVREQAAGSMADLAVVPADASPDQQRAWIREALRVFLSQMPEVDADGLRRQ
jgi:hypothetical protein